MSPWTLGKQFLTFLPKGKKKTLSCITIKTNNANKDVLSFNYEKIMINLESKNIMMCTALYVVCSHVSFSKSISIRDTLMALGLGYTLCV